jgi:histo-blood group ABO system transferase
MKHIVWLFLATLFPLFSIESPKRVKIGMCVMATGKYDTYAQGMIESARTYFCPQHQVVFFVFTDSTRLAEAPDVVRVTQARLGWPLDTLKRFHVYDAHKELFKDCDYLFAIDADMRFLVPVGDEVLGDLVGTQHYGYVEKKGPYERKKASAAYVDKKREGKVYFAGGFYGGRRDQFLELIRVAAKQVDTDLKQGFIAAWHDESHLNRYFVDHPPTVVLSPSYCAPETWDVPYPKKLMAVNKNHEEARK